METPLSSTRRVTRSQTSAAANNNIHWSRKIEESEKGVSKSRQTNKKQEDRSALIDITNDSPIGGLAMGSLETPSAALSKKMSTSRAKHNTPGSGEALLRGQVKTLLQKVEEEAELSKLSLENRPFLHLQGLVNSPLGLLAPTPANTPDLLNFSSSEESFKNNCLASVMPSPVQEQIKISETVTDIFDGEKQEGLESEKSLITRSLLLDFSEKSEGSDSSECSTVLTHKRGDGGESESKEKSSTDDDDASVWSIQVNASTREDDDEEEEEGIGEIEEEDDEDYDDYEGEDGLLDELCEGISKISVNVAKFSGKHTRFVYNSDDELEGAEECGGEKEAASPAILRLKGLPTPKGKHLRFPIELEREEEE